ncbi:SDR family NAD(P)-dependent oxidoreductase [uncultured Sphingomonas sp.]|uniref:SDR family NAD(P)-dependent oxidoreductase n=1 Tax=uncultured Sphingomonas sp. TaxID=158754 RepID=UPI0035CB8D39
MKLSSDIAAIVTGGASGMGYATARALSEQGVKVALFDKNEEIGPHRARSIGGIFCAVDVMDDASVDAGFARAREAHGQERILVNCAGGSMGPMKTATRNRETGAVEFQPSARFRWVLELNLVGTFRCITRSAAGMMALDPLDGERGAIVNTASIAAEEGQIGQVAYASAKAGIVGMTLNVARDLAGEGIRCNTILPGIFDTPMMAKAPEKLRESLGAMIPFPKRLGAAEEYAGLALFMITNGYINGEDVRLDGAVRMAPR